MIRLQLRLARADFTLDVDLQLPAQGIAAIVGPSGCGKTTLLRCAAGLEPAQGLVDIDGECWQSTAQGLFRPTWQRPLGYVFQEASLFDHLDVAGNIAYAQRRTGTGAVGGQAVEATLDLLGIRHLLGRRPWQLSGGERQRVAIARALATQPRLLLLDEPLASLDAPRRREILQWLEGLRDHGRVPMLYVTHAMEEAARLADTLVVLDRGRVQACGPLAQTLARTDLPLAQGEEAGALLNGRVLERDARWQLARVDFGSGSLWVRDDGLAGGQAVRVQVLARDVSVALEPPPPATSSIQNLLPCTVEALAPGAHASQVLVQLRCGEQLLLARITARAADALRLAPGVPAWAQVKSAALVR
ncbi:MAG TPA: molybdenum ABC transporter ATP-binding protein [Ramlibacter sp.]|nr:molybdenum ABC transporter ATP-binding protein [Ramlibacter sp.]